MYRLIITPSSQEQDQEEEDMADQKEKPSTAVIPKPKPKPELPPGPDCCAQPSYQWLCAGMECASCGMVTMWTKQFFLPPSPPPLPGHACCSCCAQFKICQSHSGCGGGGGGGCAQSKPCRSHCGCGQYYKT
ncbi:hypothetical protein IHE45_15G003600 [Dioscorea alata]|uniref:Uncharacterized protein n=1 Tax=Dioscorea alata TaxID=55571 RepID=A0ACB7UJP6_DIOAL|nr:hypothetical protein IHE45_15G003600 [Dioscorea alata]